MTRFLIVAGDPSGDLLGAKLARALKARNPGCRIAAVGGGNLQLASDEFLSNIVRRHAMGFAVSPKMINFFRKVLNGPIRSYLSANPDTVVIPVDFYGFNSRVALAARRGGHKVIYYASPQFWASRSYRADRLRGAVDLFLCLFPFEPEFYEKRGLPAVFVGHPLLDDVPEPPADRPAHVEPMVGLLPGSRPGEIRRHLPVMAEACRRITDAVGRARFVLFTVPNVPRELYHDILSRYAKERFFIELIQDEGYAWRSQLDMAIASSGLETFENALMGIPTVIMYKMSWLNYLIARMIVNVRYVGMPNLLAGRQIVPEMIQWRATPAGIADPVIDWVRRPQAARDLRAALLSLRARFGGAGASDRAAAVILDKVAA